MNNNAYLCNQCHFWNTNKNGAFNCNFNGFYVGHTNPNKMACSDFDYWRNYEQYMCSERVEYFLKLSGESSFTEGGQVGFY